MFPFALKGRNPMSIEKKQLMDIIENLNDSETTFVLRFLQRILGIA